MMRRPHILLVLAAVFGLSACSDAGQDDLRAWMDAEKARMKPRVQPVPPPEVFVPVQYGATDTVEPMDAQRVTLAIARANQRAASSLQPDMDRRREPLESFPLDAIRYVGSLEQNRQRFALLRVDRSIYQVRVGNHIGQNFGLITEISETQITLKELVQDAVGDWSERISTLELQEKAK